MYQIEVLDNNGEVKKIINSFASDITLTKKINQASELSFSLYYRDPNLYDDDYVPLLKYNTLIRLVRRRKDGSPKIEGYFYVRERRLSDEMVTFRCFGAITRLNDYLFAPNTRLKNIAPTIDVALKYCLKKFKIERVWTWKQDWDNCPTKVDINTEFLQGKDYGDAVCLGTETIGDSEYFKDYGYIITEPIQFTDYSKLEKIILRVKGTTSEETTTYFSYDYKTTNNSNWRLSEATRQNWMNYTYTDNGEGYHEIIISADQDGGKITHLRVGVVLYTSDTSSKTDLTDKEGVYGKSPVLYAIQVIGVYTSEFQDIGISSSLSNINTPEDITTGSETTNLSLMTDILNRFKLEITTDTFVPQVNYDATNKQPIKIGEDKSQYVTLIESGKGNKGDILSAPIDEDCSKLANIIYGYGAGSGIDTYFIKVENSSSIEAYGDIYGTISDSNISDITQLTQKANDELEERSRPRFNFQVDIINRAIEDIEVEGSLTDIELGDYIQYRSIVRGIDDKFRIIEITKSTEGKATLKLDTKISDLLDLILSTVAKQGNTVPAVTNLTLEGGLMI
jgi:hypothetical protein